MFLPDRPLPSYDTIERLMQQARQDRSRYILDRLIPVASGWFRGSHGHAVGFRESALVRPRAPEGRLRTDPVGRVQGTLRRPPFPMKEATMRTFALTTAALVVTLAVLITPKLAGPAPDHERVSIAPLDLLPAKDLGAGGPYDAH